MELLLETRQRVNDEYQSAVGKPHPTTWSREWAPHDGKEYMPGKRTNGDAVSYWSLRALVNAGVCLSITSTGAVVTPEICGEAWLLAARIIKNSDLSHVSEGSFAMHMPQRMRELLSGSKAKLGWLAPPSPATAPCQHSGWRAEGCGAGPMSSTARAT